MIAYVFLLTDVYPAFSLDDDPRFPVRLTVEYPERIERWRALVDWLLVLPVAIVSGLMMYVAYAVVLISWFVILFTAQFPDGLFKIVVVALRWQTNVNFYAYWMTRVYPSLS